MAKKRPKKAHWFITLPIVLLSALFYSSGSFSNLENKYTDFLFKTRLFFFGVRPIDPRLTIVGIDEASLLEFGKMPWPRYLWADLIERLMKQKPALIGLDIFFTDPDLKNPQDDELLIEATRRHRDHVVHAFYESIEAITAGDRVLPRVTVLEPFEGLLKAAKFLGFVDTQRLEDNRIVSMTDEDGSARRVFLSKITADNKLALSLGARLFAQHKGLGVLDFAKAYPDEIAINFPGVEVYKTPGGQLVAKSPYRLISCLDILKGKASAETLASLKDGFIFVASVATGAYDHFPTPYESATPGVAVHLYTLNNLLRGDYLTKLPPWVGVLVIILSGLILALSLERFSAKANSLVFGLMILGMLAASLYLFSFKNLLFAALVPALSSVCVFSTVTLYRVAVEEKEKRWIKNTFGQYLSPKVVSVLTENPDALRLGGEKKAMSVLFMDIAHFTTISEKLSPEELTKMLNYYLTKFTKVILKYDGVVDKFIGDCVMAFWNAPFPQEGHAQKACLAAMEMADIVQTQASPEFPSITIRVGINTGEMVVGNMGSAARFNYTVIGDNVNLASRLEGANKFFGTSILATEETFNRIEGIVPARKIGRVRVLGKAIPVGVYEINKKYGHEYAERLSLWSKALAALEEGSRAQAKDFLNQWIQREPEDLVGQKYLTMLENGSADFVINLEGK